MIYPKFPNENDWIGICAPSAGIGSKEDKFNQSVRILNEEGFPVFCTDAVYSDDIRSADAKQRALEVNELFEDEDIKTIMCATGGDFLFEILPYVNWKRLKAKPKWLWGMSDPTGLLFPYTVNCDVATIYGMNAGAFRLGRDYRCVRDGLSFLKGNLLSQKSYKYIDANDPFSSDYPDLSQRHDWNSNVTSLNVSGRCIGGCTDVLKDLIGTEFENIRAFNKKYESDGTIWYFDTFSLSAEVFYRTLLQMRYAGWFKHTKAVLVGRVAFPSSETGMTYEEACAYALGDIPYFTEADIGHTDPALLMINGAVMRFVWKNKSAKITFQLK